VFPESRLFGSALAESNVALLLAAAFVPKIKRGL